MLTTKHRIGKLACWRGMCNKKFAPMQKKGKNMQTQTQDLGPIRKALQDRVIRVVSEETGINRVTLGGIKGGKITKVNRSTYKMLAQYFGVADDQ